MPFFFARLYVLVACLSFNVKNGGVDLQFGNQEVLTGQIGVLRAGAGDQEDSSCSSITS